MTCRRDGPGFRGAFGGRPGPLRQPGGGPARLRSRHRGHCSYPGKFTGAELAAAPLADDRKPPVTRRRRSSMILRAASVVASVRSLAAGRGRHCCSLGRDLARPSRSLKDVQSLLNDEKRRCDSATVRSTQQQRRQLAEHAGRLSGLSGADRSQHFGWTRNCRSPLGDALLVGGADEGDKEASREARSKGQDGQRQGTAPDGTRQRHDQYPQHQQQTLEAVARSRAPLPGTIYVLQRVRHHRRQEGTGMVCAQRGSATDRVRGSLDQLDERPQGQGRRSHH